MSDETDTTLTRRAMLKRGAVVGGALMWAVPTVQSISGTALAAPAGSVLGVKHHRKPPEVGGVKHRRLPFTGSAVDPLETAVVGGSLVVAGAVTVETVRRRRNAALPAVAMAGDDAVDLAEVDAEDESQGPESAE